MLVPIPFAIAGLLAIGGDLMAGFQPLLPAPPITSDQLALLRTDNVVAEGARGLQSLGVTPTALEAILPAYLGRYRKGGQYADLIEPATRAG